MSASSLRSEEASTSQALVEVVGARSFCCDWVEPHPNDKRTLPSRRSSSPPAGAGATVLPGVTGDAPEAPNAADPGIGLHRPAVGALASAHARASCRHG
jgi:hypothetical protein